MGYNDRDRWNVVQYTNHSRARLRQILEAIGHGQVPMGHINLFSKLPDNVDCPSRDVCMKVENQLWDTIEEAKVNSKLLQRYNLQLSLEQRGKGFIIRFNYSPDDVSRLSKKQTEE